MYFTVITKGCRTKLNFVAGGFAVRDTPRKFRVNCAVTWAFAHSRRPGYSAAASRIGLLSGPVGVDEAGDPVHGQAGDDQGGQVAQGVERYEVGRGKNGLAESALRQRSASEPGLRNTL